MLKRLLIGCIILQATCCWLFSIERMEQNLKFENEAGWTWHINPAPFAPGDTTVTAGMVMRMDELKGDRLLLTFAYSEKSGKDIVRLRPVAFDDSGRRFEFKAFGGASDEGVKLSGFVLDLKEFPLERIKSIGIEKLTKDGLRTILAPASFRKLKEAGVDALPFPQLGERYDFELTSIDGMEIRSKELRGKVVLLDFWAKYCGPCMKKMPKLKETYQRLNKRGFEVIGLNHDSTLEKAKDTIAKNELPWPNVFAPFDNGQRELWFTASGTDTLPRLLLIDREGILRAEVSPDNLDAEIEKLVDKP
jgi:thiol-disulfide isomerase/thioredoxin